MENEYRYLLFNLFRYDVIIIIQCYFLKCSLTLFSCNIFVILDIDLCQVSVVSNRYKHETLETFHSLKDLFLILLCNIVYSLQGSIVTQDIGVLSQVAVSV